MSNHRKIKDKSQRVEKVSINTPVQIDHIVFSFRYLTSNKNYSFFFFGDMRKRHDAYETLFQKMQKLSEIGMEKAKQIGKIEGCEPIPFRRLSNSVQKICDGVEIISRDSSLAVFRFNSQEYRLLCKTDLHHPNVLHVIGFDFDFSAYNHG